MSCNADGYREASMFFKSCNCNSSIATRVGFAVGRNSYLPRVMQIAELHATLDHILLELDVRLVNEDADCYKAD